MGRESKYRGRHINTGEWVYGYLIGNDVIVGEIVEFNDDYFNTEYWYRVDPETVGQYTGLKDKNSREIYKGDILFWEQKGLRVNTVVSFKDGMFLAGDMPLYDCLDEEIIGNIYENPELLEM